MKDIKVRQFINQDQEAVYQLHIEGLKQAESLIDDPEARKQLDQDLININKSYIDNGGDFIIVTLEEKIIGMGALIKINNTTAEVKRMRVKPNFQGKHVGSLILDKLIERAKKFGYKKIILDTSVKQIPAQNLYQSRGFKEYKRGVIFGQDRIFYELDISI